MQIQTEIKEFSVEIDFNQEVLSIDDNYSGYEAYACLSKFKNFFDKKHTSMDLDECVKVNEVQTFSFNTEHGVVTVDSKSGYYEYLEISTDLVSFGHMRNLSSYLDDLCQAYAEEEV